MKEKVEEMSPLQRLLEIEAICQRASRVAPKMRTRWNYALKESDCDRIWDLAAGKEVK